MALPQTAWNDSDDLCPPGEHETVVINSLLSVMSIVHDWSKSSRSPPAECDVLEDPVLKGIIQGRITLRNNMDLSSIMNSLVNITKDMLTLDERVTRTFLKEYIKSGTTHFDDLGIRIGIDPDTAFMMFNYVMDIKIIMMNMRTHSDA